MKTLLKFKHLLEYFAAHLEWVENNDPQGPGYDTYIAPLLADNRFKETGFGYLGHKIQQQIADWETCDGDRVCINIQWNYKTYQSKKSYLNWCGTGVNVTADWADNHIFGLSLCDYKHWEKKPSRERITAPQSLQSLGLFDGTGKANEALAAFYARFRSRYEAYLEQEKTKAMDKKIAPYLELLRQNRNLILTGAPGSGKTYLARQLAEALGAQTAFVQFHPNYDYTDFVEGLRPCETTDNGTIGFELRDGIFKSFCREALENLINSEKSGQELSAEAAFEQNYYVLLDLIRDGKVADIPQRTSKAIDIVEISDWGNIILRTAESACGETYTVSLERLKKLARVFKNRQEVEQIKNIYQEITAVIGGGHASAYWAVLHYIYDKFPVETQPVGKVERKDYVMIVDEINRGEISRIFGELFFSLDPGYRGVSGAVRTQYANLCDAPNSFDDVLHALPGNTAKTGNGWFFVPENVYLIGTMNDIDRSVESMDFAMRRRFAWAEIGANDHTGMLDALEEDVREEALARLKRLNAAIWDETAQNGIESLSPAYHIGGAYFKLVERYLDDRDTAFARLWENHLRGVLFEYLRGMPAAAGTLQMLKAAYDGDAPTA